MPMGPPIIPGLFAAMGFMAVLVILIALIIAGFFLMIGAKFAGIEDVTLGKSMIAVVGGGILALLIGWIPAIGWILGIIAYIWVIKTVFNTDWGKAAIAWLMTIVVEIIVMFAFMVLLGISVALF
ncbi:MAG TPA: DUF3810 domain-containing protein [Thermococcaceae archaeon]|uniref:Yip1 domain-containing protein n=2 Tax=Thermococcus sibiricus TaxID=172049 RepID=C6A3V5_THESM|nr:hypothetical protein [Thermococcus sibiricus]ACS90300.1 hypothetical protein TSIB_1246 [Thermococcus sibiricus MM 739]HII67460.1 DUF3810 domain-containing protein [Thermococcaceae archaeon]